MRIVITDKIDLTPEAVEELKSLGDVTIYNDIPKTEEEIIKRIEGAEIVTANWVDVQQKTIEVTPTLKYIIVPAVGYEWIDLKTASAKGIKVLNCPTQNSAAVANLTMTLIFAVTRKLIEANKDLRSGKWQPGVYKGVELEGKTLGLIGYGHIGQLVAKQAEVLGMKVQHANSKATKEELDNLISSSDILSLHAPLTDMTIHVIDERRLGLMKKGSYLINTARGKEIDKRALIKALDVFDGEPLTGSPSEEIVKLANMTNVVATPHIGFNTEETYVRMGRELIDNIKSCIAGDPINVVN